MAAPAAPEPAYQAPVSQGNLYYYYYPVQVTIAITITKFERWFVNQWTNGLLPFETIAITITLNCPGRADS